MSHSIRIYDDLFYEAPNVPDPTLFWEAIDLTMSKAINGDDGGTWTPSNVIIIGGMGVEFGGPILLTGGATCENLLGSGTRFVHGDSDYFTLAIGHTASLRTLPQSMGEAIDMSDLTSQIFVSNQVATTQTTTTASAPGLLLPLNVHDGAIISQVDFLFSVAAHSGVPDKMPLFRVFAIDLEGNVFPLNTTDPNNIAGGFQSPTKPASGSAWHASGATQTFTYACDVSSFDNPPIAIDMSKYMYFAEIFDETGANSVAGNDFYGTKAHFGVGTLRPQ